MREHNFSPPEIHVLAPGDGTRALVGVWRDEQRPWLTEVVSLIMDEASALEVAEKLTAPAVQVYKTLPGQPDLSGGL